MRIRTLAYGAAAVVAAATLIACGSGDGSTDADVSGNAGKPVASAPAAATAPTAKPGQTVTLSAELLGSKDSATVTLSNPKQFKTEPGTFGSKPERGVYLVVDVAVTCTEGTYYVSPGRFKFVSADGTVYDPSYRDFKPELEGIDLAAGQKTAGKIVFDVPVAAVKGGKIQLDGLHGDFDKPAAYWAL